MIFHAKFDYLTCRIWRLLLLLSFCCFSLCPTASLSNGQLNGCGSKGGHKQDGSHSQSTDGGSEYSEDNPAKKRWVISPFLFSPLFLSLYLSEVSVKDLVGSLVDNSSWKCWGYTFLMLKKWVWNRTAFFRESCVWLVEMSDVFDFTCFLSFLALFSRNLHMPISVVRKM